VSKDLYRERLRPQFHFTAKTGWKGDPIGLVYYKGEYHLCYIFIPRGSRGDEHNLYWGKQMWGHAVSPDLVHWTELDPAILPKDDEFLNSGSALVDWNNTAGLQTGDEKTIIAIYSLAGPAADGSKVTQCTQCLSFSNDHGRTWTKYEGNPVLPNVDGMNRDPKVFWYKPDQKWVMIFYIEKGDTYTLYESADLKHWMHMSDYHFPGHGECPDLFPLQVDGDPNIVKWVLVAGNGDYMIGMFDGKKFTPDSGPYIGDYGANYYATQTYSDTPDGRRIQFAWMRKGEFPDMPFNQQMNFPTELKLKTLPVGVRLCRTPVKEIENVHAKSHKFRNALLIPGDNLLSGIHGGLFDVRTVIEVGEASEFGFVVNGQTISYSVKDKTLTCLRKSAKLAPVDGQIKLQILVDRTSIEIYGNDGEVVMTSFYLPTDDKVGISSYSVGAITRVKSLQVYELKSAWGTGSQ